MATTGELRAIVEELELVDIGDAASLLGDESSYGDEEAPLDAEEMQWLFDLLEKSGRCDCSASQG
ncbi:MAG: hypothetical protein IMW89_15005 [Ktedonobacteraceae bacterium]|nr:hypothetical protein [Ktedonobacteraceae bacterium]